MKKTNTPTQKLATAQKLKNEALKTFEEAQKLKNEALKMLEETKRITDNGLSQESKDQIYQELVERIEDKYAKDPKIYEEFKRHVGHKMTIIAHKYISSKEIEKLIPTCLDCSETMFQEAINPKLDETVCTQK